MHRENEKESDGCNANDSNLSGTRKQLSRSEGVEQTSADGIMLIRLGDPGAKVHRCILCIFKETGKASYSWYEHAPPCQTVMC